jgi:Tol biopolymer transport system component
VFENDGDGVEIYRAEWRDGLFLEPELLIVGDGTVRITNPTVAPDEDYLLFVSDHAGNADIYVSRRLADGGWAELEALGPAVNSEYTEFAPSVSSDGRTLYFTSERPGMVPENAGEGRRPGDIYSVPVESVLP